MKGTALAVIAALALGYGVTKLPNMDAAAAPAPAGPAADSDPAMDAEPEFHEGPIHADWLEEHPMEDEAAAEDAETIPVALSLKEEVGPGYTLITYLVVQSTVDEVAVSSVEVNRGNCIALMTAWEPGAHYPTHKEVDSPITLPFGRELRLQPSCNGVLEAQVTTDRGVFDFTFAPF